MSSGRKGDAPERVPLPTPMYYGATSFFNSSKPSRTTSFQPSVPPYPEDSSPVGTAPPATSSTFDNQVLGLFEQAILHFILCNFIVLQDAIIPTFFLMYSCQLVNCFCIDATVATSVNYRMSYCLASSLSYWISLW